MVVYAPFLVSGRLSIHSILLRFYVQILGLIIKLWVPRLLSLRRPVRNLVGFWGQTGAFAFCHEDTGLFFTGTVNQANGFGHGKAFKAMLAVIKRAMAEGARA